MQDLAFYRNLLVANAVLPLAILMHDAFYGKLGSDPATTALHTTGITSLILLILTLAITPIRLVFKWNWIIAFRRPLGLLSFFYAALHYGIYLVIFRHLSFSQIIDDIVKTYYIPVGYVAFFIMLALDLTSTNKMVQRLGPKRWKALHRLAYLAAFVGIVHYFFSVKIAEALPWTLALAFSALMIFRLVYWTLASPTPPPASPQKYWSGQLRVQKIIQETPNVKTFQLAPVDGKTLPFTYLAGQYLNIDLPTDTGRVRRSYTISSAPKSSAVADASGVADTYCTITVKREDNGLASRFLHDKINEGDVLDVAGPAGKFTSPAKPVARQIFIAGGVGITPIMSMIRTLVTSKELTNLHLFYFNRTQQDVIFSDELAALEKKHPTLQISHFLTRENDTDWTGEKGYLTAQALTQKVSDIKEVPVYLCGPEPMMASVLELLESLGVPRENIKTESFTTPAAGATSTEIPEPADANGKTSTVEFLGQATLAHADQNLSVLELAEAEGLELSWECRAGVCGQCRVRLTEGQVTMNCHYALTDKERAEGYVLACQAKPRSEKVVIDTLNNLV